MNNQHVIDKNLAGSDSKQIYGSLHLPLGASKPGTVICSHGFKGYKDYGFIPHLCSQICLLGVKVYRFNFSHSGMTNNVTTFARPDLFEQDTWGRQIDDLFSVLQSDVVDGPVYLVGHSRGGDTSLLTGARLSKPEQYGLDPSNVPAVDLRGIATLSTPADACRYSESDKNILRAQGRLLSPSGRTKQDLYVGRDWLDEIEDAPTLYDPVIAAGNLQVPILVVHGGDDATVPVSDAGRISAAANAEKIVVESANHVFNSPNPLESEADVPKQTHDAVYAVTQFLSGMLE